MKLLPDKQILKKKLKRKTIIFFTACIAIISASSIYTKPADINAQSNSGLWNEINQLQGQMSQLSTRIQQEVGQLQSLQGKIQSNTQTISQLQDIISQKQQLISEKQSQIDLLNQSISDEKTQIDALNAKINSLYADFVQRARISYENSYVDPLLITLGNKSITDVFANLEYFTNTRKQDSDLLSQMKDNQFTMQQKLNDLSVQEADLATAQSQLVNEQNGLKDQQSQLQTQLASLNYSKNSITHQLSSDQVKYEELVSQMNSMQVAVYGGNTGCVAGNWWYFNQQCYGRLQGMYGTSIDMTYGCLITDIAMVATKELGAGYTPPEIAARTWFSGNYMAAWPSLPIGPHLLYSQSDIDSQINQGHPVIVYLSAPSGEHWVVLYQVLGGGNYLINDPWYGSGLTFLGTGGGTHEYYSLSEMGDAYALY